MTESTAVLEQPSTPKVRKPVKRVNYALAGTLLASGLNYDEIAPRVGSASGNSLRAGLGRKGVTLRQVRNMDPVGDMQVTVTAKIAHDASEIVKDRLHGTLLTAADALGRKKITAKSLASRGQGDAATLKQLAETWRTLNGNPDSITFQFGASRLSDARETPQAVVDCGSAVEVTPTPDTPPVQGA